MDWIEWLAEEKIRKALTQGELRKNRYFGKPVRLEPENPHLPREWWAAFYLLEIHRLAPLWILRGRWLRQAIRSWREDLRRVLFRFPGSGPLRQAALARLRTRLDSINQHIREYNWSIPRGVTPMAPLDWDEEYRRAAGR